MGRDHRRLQARIIPARAGFTRTPRRPCGPRKDHPRSRGVYDPAIRRAQSPEGSSPLARGLRAGRSVLPGRMRIIPARAGFTGRGEDPHRPPGDHPRSRGVYAWAKIAAGGRFGSSPLARGLPYHVSATRNFRRIIPARAGFTPSSRPPSPRTRDHPRSRGVYGRADSRGRWVGGSSPLARGLRDAEREGPPTERIIPARAGFTTASGRPVPPASDHPRSRGVYPAPAPPTGRLVGSSPLARGLQRLHVEGVRGEGIIPARAGFTKHRRHRERRVGDHPRSRGVYRESMSQGRRGGGSSPLARGLRRSPE